MLIQFTASVPADAMAQLLGTIMESDKTFANGAGGWFEASLDSMQEWNVPDDAFPHADEWRAFTRPHDANIPWYLAECLWDDDKRAVIFVKFLNAAGELESRNLVRQDFINGFTTFFAADPCAFGALSLDTYDEEVALHYWQHVLFGKVIHS